MSRSRRVMGGAVLLGAALMLALAHGGHDSRPPVSLRPAEVRAQAHREEVGAPPSARTATSPSPAARAPVATTAAAMTREEKQVLSHAAEARRIAEREQKLAALDWNAPRPGAPPADRRVPVSKKEEELTPEEKLEKTERITTALEERIRRTQRAVDAATKSGNDAGVQVMLLARLQSSLAELEDRAQGLRGERNERGAASMGGQVPAFSPQTLQ
jgi:hypothetical protein